MTQQPPGTLILTEELAVGYVIEPAMVAPSPSILAQNSYREVVRRGRILVGWQRNARATLGL